MSETAGGSSRLVTAPRGTAISCRGWLQEAALRMLMNNLDPEVAERPADLVVYGGSGKAARDWNCFDAIVAALRRLEDDETLLVQSGKPVAIFKSHADAPRVLIANSNLVPRWATIDEFRRLEGLGLTMYGQMTAGSWIYIGTQGILQGTYETLAELARRHFGGSLAGRLTVTAGLGGMGGAQPLAVTMNEGVCLVAEVDRSRIEKRLEKRYLDEWAPSRRGRPGAGPRRDGEARGGLDRRRGERRRAARAAARRGDPPRRRHRPDFGARQPARLRPARHLLRRGARPAQRRRRAPMSSAPWRRWRRTCGRCSSSSAAAR